MTFYDILGVPRDASQEEIRTAYRDLARRYHPDGMWKSDESTRADAEENLKAINAAYHALSDPGRRRAYHDLMWTRQDPARDYRFKPPPSRKRRNGYTNGTAGSRPRSSAAAAIALQILQARQELQHTIERQEVKRRRFWMSAGFTSLIIYFLMAFGAHIYPSAAEALPLVVFFIGGEMIALSIVLNASGTRFPRFPYAGHPVVFSLTVSLGAMLTCSSAPRLELNLSQPTGFYSGMLISFGLLVHLLLALRLSRAMDAVFDRQLRDLTKRLHGLETRLKELQRQ